MSNARITPSASTRRYVLHLRPEVSMEVVKDYRGDTFRAVYTVRFADTLYASTHRSEFPATPPDGRPGMETVTQLRWQLGSDCC